MVKGWVDGWELEKPFESQTFISVWEGENITNPPSIPIIIFKAEKVEEVVKLLHSISFPLDEWPKLKKALAILEEE